MNIIKYWVPVLLCLLSIRTAIGQTNDAQKDSIYIAEVQDSRKPYKVLHAEPLYIDLIRDLGARKGEKEWNIGLGLTDNLNFDSYEALVEYEWAPVDRLGLEVELPFTFYTPLNGTSRELLPSNRLNSLKLAAQWTFLVSEKRATSMALGYINEFELSDFRNFGEPLVKGNIYNPFLVVAKRWGNNFHSLIYTGPMIEQMYESKAVTTHYDINTSFHYMISGTRNFIGIEFNKTLGHADFDMTIRPQMRLGLAEDLLVGIVAGIPVQRENQRFSSFVRLIWEPGHRTKNKKRHH
ncbi:HAEPLYID family protein [Roseivirga sp. UBA838]|uniref:HAEPLYID family protein n=1 Tax=Roseivirga sp. UBA838 TaxID=1947393 RepID=UPI00257D43E2|nr:HAEPLYID family protein [Roseivirga sp. UBA838]|tara:strand:- start:1376 stop:2257 length:882 start_codon:yes stop_codon:yes gene_type:complete